MTSTHVLVSDTHGCWFTLIRLLNQVVAQHPGARFVSLGDEIDRGPHSRAVVEFMMTNRLPSVASNHIDLCLAYSAHARRGYKARCASYYDRDVWLFNGGEEALANWLPDQTRWREGLPKDVLDWMAALPPYIVLDGPPDEQGRRCLASHTGYALEADSGGWFGALWGRHAHGDGPFPEDGYHRVFGHTQAHEVQSGPGWHMIDTGAAYAKRGMGTLTAFLWPTKALIAQPFDESTVERTFDVVDGRLTPR